MPSLEYIPEEEVLDTSSRRSSANSKRANSKKTNSKAQSSSGTRKTGATNSRAQSSTDSQKARATARSKLIEEAKRVGGALRALRPEFDISNNRFSKKVREGNNEIFDKWEFLIADTENCAGWGPKMKSHMDLRLQNPPGKDGMFQVVPRMIFFTQLYRDGFPQRILREIHNACQAATE